MRNHFPIAALAAVSLAAVSLAAAAPAAAQTDSIRACYVPTTGNVYRIGTPDTHPNCVAASHVRFAWPATFPNLGIGGRYLLRLRSGSPISNRFFVDSAGGVAALGELGVGDIPVSGPGYRMMWFPNRAAFRAGGVTASEWDDPNIGFFSWAGGFNSIATGYNAFAFGQDNNVSGTYGVAFGSTNAVAGTGGFAAGLNASCDGLGCVSMGFRAAADGTGSVALGYRVTA